MTSRRAYSVALAMLLAAVALVLLPASGLAQSAAQTRVGASPLLATARTGDFTPLAAISQLGQAHAYDDNASGSLLAAEGEGGLLAAARAARDAQAAEVGATRATVSAGYRLDTGEIASGCSGPGCAEDAVVRALGGGSGNIRFTEAIRPRTGQEVPICLACQAKYSPGQFPEGTQFLPGGWVEP